MKKKVGIIYSFLFVFAMMFIYIVTNNIVKAVSPIEPGYKYKYENANGSVTITEKGSIVVEYKYGIPEIVVQVKRCSEYLKDSQVIKDRNISEADNCNGFDGGTTIIHVSGALNAKPEEGNGQKVIHLFKKGFSYDEIVEIKIQTEFFSSNTGHSMAFCDKDMGGTCSDYDEDTGLGGIAYFSLIDRYGETVDLQFDKDQTIYDYSGVKSNDAWMKCLKVYNSSNAVERSDVESAFVRIDNSEFSTVVMDDMIYDDIIPVLVGVLVIAAGVSIAVLGYQIVKSADEDQERHDKIKRLRNILLGIGIAILLLFVMEPMSKFIEGFLE